MIQRITGRDLALAALLLGLLFFAYLPALNGGILWDDDAHIPKPELRSLNGLWRIWTELGAAQQYYPLLFSAFWFENQIWGDSVTSYHVFTLLLHAAAALLLVAVLRLLLIPGAWIAAFLFALHPVAVESVAWIAEQKNTLSAVFYLSAALFYLKFDRTRQRRTYWIAFTLFFAALLTKSVTATLPAALLLVIWWKRGKLDVRKDVQPLAPWLFAGAALGLFTAWMERNYVGAQGSHFDLSLMDRFFLAGHVVWFYFLKLIWPANLMFVYPRWTQFSPLYLLGVLAVAGALIALAKRNRSPLVAMLFFLGTLFPVLGFFNVYPFVFSYVADHFQYLASLGVIVPAAVLLSRLGSKATLAATAICAVLLFLTWKQTPTYQNVYALYVDTLARNPDAWLAHNELGLILGRVPGRTEEAIDHLQSAKRLQPDSAEVRNNLGVVLSDVPGRASEAVPELQEALKLRPNYAEAHNNLGTALSEIPDRKSEAIAEYEAALRAVPDYAEAHNNLGSALSESEATLPQAIEHFEAAVRINPSMAEAHANLGVALAKTPSRAPEAIGHLQAALSLRPDMQQVRQLLNRMQTKR